MTTITPTHRTNRDIGQIKADSPIRVAQFDVNEYFTRVLGRLGVDALLCNWHYFEQAVKFRDPNGRWHTALHDDYIITDGNHIEVSTTDSGWSTPPARKVSGTEKVNISFHETYYCLYGEDTDTTIRVTAQTLHELVEVIEASVTKTSPIANAMFIWGTPKIGPSEPLVRDGDFWYDCVNEAYTEDEVLELYTELGVIR